MFIRFVLLYILLHIAFTHANKKVCTGYSNTCTACYDLAESCTPADWKTIKSCPPGWFHYDKTNKCFKLSNFTGTFTQIHNHCVENSATLASIHSADENYFVANLIKTQQKTEDGEYAGWSYIGFLKLANGNFYWLDGSVFNYTNWATNQPNGDAPYGSIISLEYDDNWGFGLWDDLGDTNREVNGVCQIQL